MKIRVVVLVVLLNYSKMHMVLTVQTPEYLCMRELHSIMAVTKRKIYIICVHGHKFIFRDSEYNYLSTLGEGGTLRLLTVPQDEEGAQLSAF